MFEGYKIALIDDDPAVRDSLAQTLDLAGIDLVVANSLPAEPIPAPDDVAAPPANAQKTESGLASKILITGKGSAHPAKADLVTVHYTGWTTDGKMFDTSRTGKPATFPLNKVIAGWTEGERGGTLSSLDAHRCAGAAGWGADHRVQAAGARGLGIFSDEPYRIPA